MTKKQQTPLIETEVFNEYGLGSAYIKDESANPYGTIKDRRSALIVKEADRLRVNKLALITSGNNGYSLAKIAQETDIKVVCIVDRSIDKKTLDILRDVAYHVIELNLNEKILRPEEIIAFARERDDEVIWDVTNGYEEAYTPIVNEIFSKLSVIDYIVVPVGSGGIFIGLVQALERTQKPTKIIGVGTHAPYKSVADKLSTPWSPYTNAIENYTKNGHSVLRLTEKEIRETFQKYRHLVMMEPSSSVVFAVPQKYTFEKDDVVVFLNSGRSVVE